MILAISGVPGTGKTTLAKQLSLELTWEYIDVTALIKEHKLYDSYDDTDETFDVDVPKLNAWLNSHLDLTKDLIVDSLFSHEFTFIDKVIVCGCDLSVLNKRLIGRGYSKQKIKDNLEAQTFDICFIEANEAGKDVVKVDCSGDVDVAAVAQSLK